MFTGIIEQIGVITDIEESATNNKTFTVQSSISKELKVDQSVSHNGVCLTVVKKDQNSHQVTAIQETLTLTTSSDWVVGTHLNLERAAMLNHRLDGHIVQGHVDSTAKVIDLKDEGGSIRFFFEFNPKFASLVISKGSICIDGVSLTVIEPSSHQFHVAIIPYTLEHTVFKHYKIGSLVNLEFDIIGKYILRHAELNR